MFFGESVMRSPHGSFREESNINSNLGYGYQQNSYSREKIPEHSFMSSLATMYGPQQVEELERKRRQQIEFAETLRQQIEEKKKQNSKIEKQPTYKSVADQAEQMLSNIRQNQSLSNNEEFNEISQFSFSSNIKVPKHNHLEPIKPHLLTEPIVIPPAHVETSQIPTHNFSQTSPPQQIKLLQTMFNVPYESKIDIPTESPFSRSSVITPPLGFSMRKSLPSKTYASTLPPSDFTKNKSKNREKTNKEISKTSILDPSIYKISTQKRKQKINREEPEYRLGTNSEFIYPDGHISNASSS